MESVEILELFSRYGIDAAILAAVASVFTAILNYTLFNKLNLSDRAKRAVKLIPYALGILFYSFYSLFCNTGISCFFENLAEIVKQGLAIGTLSFVLCLFIDKIIGGKVTEITDVKAIETLIEGYISADEIKNVAKLLREAILKGESGNVEKILASYAAEDVTEAELEIVKLLIFNYYGIDEN